MSQEKLTPTWRELAQVFRTAGLHWPAHLMDEEAARREAEAKKDWPPARWVEEEPDSQGPDSAAVDFSAWAPDEILYLPGDPLGNAGTPVGFTLADVRRLARKCKEYDDRYGGSFEDESLTPFLDLLAKHKGGA